MNEGHKTVSDRNHRVFLLENLKTFLRRLFSDLLNIAKVHTWDVRVENQIEIPEQIDTRPEIERLIEAVANIPEAKETDVTSVVEAIKAIPETVIPDFPKPKETNYQPDIEKASQAIVEAIKSIPEVKPTDLSVLEKLLSDKTVSVKEGKQIVSLLKMVVDKLSVEEPKEKGLGKKLAEQIEFYSDGSFKKSTEVYENMSITTERSLDDVYSYEYKEMNVNI
jgi:hypothetical protein